MKQPRLKFPLCVVGLQWGDEGKGKIVDYLNKFADFSVRYQGGPNAGHTVYYKQNKVVLHHLPAGVLYPKCKCVIGNGLVIDPEVLQKEIMGLEALGISLKNRLFISERAHVVFPFHKALDKFFEDTSPTRLGTTLRGVGPCYNDKISRVGMRVIDLFDERYFVKQLEVLAGKVGRFIQNGTIFNRKEIASQYRKYRDFLRPYVADTASLLNSNIDRKKILFEGAHGTLLSIEFGTYPFVTSSCSEASGVSAGAGIPPTRLRSVIGVAKAYATRVGEGPFPSELSGKMADYLQLKGSEFGSTTGRKRRVGWFDTVSARYACTINGITSISLTKLDVLSGIKDIYVCTAYRYKGSVIRRFPAGVSTLAGCRPVLRKIKGWHDNLQAVNAYKELPSEARNYIRFLEDHLEASVDLVSVGREREATLIK